MITSSPALADAEVESIAAGGDGVARVDGRVVFIPRAAPGDHGTVRLTPRGRYAMGEWMRIESPSTQRVDPPCGHYTMNRCGGCQLQHLNAAAQRAAKAGIVVDALRRIGSRTVDRPLVRPSPLEWRYRQKLTLALRRREDGVWIAGLRPYDDPADVFALDDCLITAEPVIAVWRAILRAAPHLPPAQQLRGAVRLADAGASLVIEGGSTWPARDPFFEAVPALTVLWWAPSGKRRRKLAEREGAMADAASFAQVNPAAAAVLQDAVVALIRSYTPSHVVDAYAGSGLTAAAIAADGARVTAIEVDAEAARVAAARLPKGSRAITGRVEDHLERSLPADVVVLNPPRSGADPRVCEVLEAEPKRPRAVLYVSCDPATLARDLKRLPTFDIRSLTCFDMFPQTAHVETVCELVPTAR
ncbi:MAG: 23S rRNA (uracil(1939)-C(5))-methyltransferase RlmD [Gemmatimonadaceae bacterium]